MTTRSNGSQVNVSAEARTGSGAQGNVTAVMHGINEVRVEQRPMPEPGEREVLVEVRSVGVCGSDVHFFEHGRIGLSVVEPPHVLGHEAAGVVVAHGPGASRPPVGSRVALEPSLPCGRCRLCREGRYNLCPDMRYFSDPPTNGAFTRYLTLHEDFAFPVPDNVSDDAAALIEPVSVVLWAARCAELKGGDHILVTGAGPIGLLMTQVARALGATEVVVSDVNPTRLDRAEQVGATRVVDISKVPLHEAGVEVDVFIECSGHPEALADGIRCVRAGGVATVVGMGPHEDATIPLAIMQAREIRLQPTFRFANTYPAAIDLVASGAVNPETIVTGHFGLEDIEQALWASRRDPASIKPIVRPQQ